MAALLNILLSMILFLGTGDKRTVQESEIREVIDRYVASNFEDSGADYRLEYRSMPTKALSVPRNATLQVAVEPGVPVSGNIIIPVEVFADNHVVHTFVVSIKVRTFGQVLIATDMIEKHESADQVAATEEQIETTQLPEDVIRFHTTLAGKRSKQIIRKGAVLTESMFERIPVVNQGATVTLIMKTNNVVVKAKAIARQDGSSGDVVIVQKEGTGDKLKARVVDAKTVELLAAID